MIDERRQYVTTTISSDGVVQQRQNENLYKALNCLIPVSSECEICKVVKSGKLVTIIRGYCNTEGTWEWAWRSRMDQDHNDRKNRLKLHALSEKTKVLTDKHNACCIKLEPHDNSTEQAKKDYENIKRLSTKQFNLFVDTHFEGFVCCDITKALLNEFIVEYQEPTQTKSNKINVNVSCVKCGRCGESHVGQQVYLDDNNIPFVTCCNTNKRVDVLMNISKIDLHTLHSLRNIMYGTVFTIDDGDKEANDKLKQML